MIKYRKRNERDNILIHDMKRFGINLKDINCIDWSNKT